MDARVRAGIDLYGTTLRYAEVERYATKRPARTGGAEGHASSGSTPGEHRLLRLGSCDFDFDVTRALWGDGPGTEKQVHTLAEALADVYEGTSAQELRVVVHPPQAHSFFAPVPAQMAEADRLARFRREAQLLARAGARPATGAQEAQEPGEAPLPGEDPLHVAASGLYTEGDDAERREWFHVLAVGGGAHERFRRVMEEGPLPDFRWAISMEGAAQAAAVLEHRREARTAPEAPFTLAVGCYHEHLELSLCCHGRFHFALHAPRAQAADSAYFAAALLERLGTEPSLVGRVFVYGYDQAPGAFAPLERLTGTAPQPLDFRPIVGLKPDRLTADFEAGVYVPCIGAAL